MAITKRQKELDLVKWLKSEEIGQDACGSFDYCACCNKALENPCDKAYLKFNKKPAKKTTATKEVAVTKVKSVKKTAKKTTK